MFDMARCKNVCIAYKNHLISRPFPTLSKHNGNAYHTSTLEELYEADEASQNLDLIQAHY